MFFFVDCSDVIELLFFGMLWAYSFPTHSQILTDLFILVKVPLSIFLIHWQSCNVHTLKSINNIVSFSSKFQFSIRSWPVGGPRLWLKQVLEQGDAFMSCLGGMSTCSESKKWLLCCGQRCWSTRAQVISSLSSTGYFRHEPDWGHSATRYFWDLRLTFCFIRIIRNMTEACWSLKACIVTGGVESKKILKSLLGKLSVGWVRWVQWHGFFTQGLMLSTLFGDQSNESQEPY